ncbi:snoRNA binding domain, fibrillarin domain-containing protein [Ditylenchus destructor]|nr:snoRNA binding domain, fibrillarin domain-containing protein [Ditylenchus destructor]
MDKLEIPCVSNSATAELTKKVLKSLSKEAEELAVGDTKLGSIIKEKMEIPCVSNSATAELMRGIRANVDTLLAEQKAEITAMRLALAHIRWTSSLVGLAKCPASTVQILGAEKALFRALKTKKDTPKYGIIYHAQLISQTSTKLKGKIARKLAAKVSLSTRIDALSDETTGNEVGISSRAFLEGVIKSEMERGPKRISGVKQAPSSSYSFKKEVYEYDTAADVNLKPKKRPPTDPEGGTAAKKVKEEDSAETTEVAEEPPKKKKKTKNNSKYSSELLN